MLSIKVAVLGAIGGATGVIPGAFGEGHINADLFLMIWVLCLAIFCKGPNLPAVVAVVVAVGKHEEEREQTQSVGEISGEFVVAVG